ncbi:hypothetical protein D3C84_309460 [compost metagenome]
MQLVDGIADQAGRALGFVEEQQRGVDHLAIGEAADAQAVAVLRARQLEGAVVAPAHGEIEAGREVVQLLETRLLDRDFGEGVIRQLAAAAVHQALVEGLALRLAAFEQRLHGGGGLAVQGGQQRGLALELHLAALGVGDGARPFRTLPLVLAPRRHRRVVGAALLVDPGEIGRALLRAGVAAPFQYVGVNVLARALAIGQDEVALARLHLAGGVEAVLQVAAGVHPGEVAPLALAAAAAAGPAGVVAILQARLVALHDALGRLALLFAVASVDEGVVHPALVVDPGQVATAAGVCGAGECQGDDQDGRFHQKVVW